MVLSARDASLLDDRYEFEERIGAGGMGEVYRARDLGAGGARVAVKLLRAPTQDKLERFFREAALLSEMRHPAIVCYVAHGVAAAQRPYLVMEWLEGETLSERLLRGPLSAHEAFVLAQRISAGLSVAHERGVAHRDIKPSNLFLVRGQVGEAKILDFGIARRVFQHDPSSRADLHAGTPAYMSPEQARGAVQLDVCTDIFSLGATLYEAITSSAPFRGENLFAVAAEICLQDPVRPRELSAQISPAFERLLLQMLEKEPSLRPRNARDLARALSEVGAPSMEPLVASEAPSRWATLEQRVVSVVVIAGFDNSEETLTHTEVVRAPQLTALRELLATYRARFESLGHGVAVACFGEESSPTDQLDRAARLALAIAEMYPDAQLAIAQGRAVLHGRLALGEVVERARKLLGRDEGRILVAAGAIELLGARYRVEPEPWGARLVGEQDQDEGAASVLGRRSPFVGRVPELNALERAFAVCAESASARAALVVAPAGAGKTRLWHEWQERLLTQHPSCRVLVGQGDPIRSSAPFGLLGSVLRRSAGVARGDDLPTRQRKLRALVKRSVHPKSAPNATEFLGELCDSPFPDATCPALQAARQDARLMGDQLQAAWLSWLRGLLAQSPLVLVLEDLHWADLPSVQLLDASLRALAGRPLFLLSVARPEVAERFPRLWEERNVEVVPLCPLAAESAEHLVREVLGSQLDPALVKRLVQQSEGNVFFLEELMRAVASGQGQALPDSVMAVLQRRLDQLGPDAARVLRAASVFGENFSVEGVAALTGESARRTAEHWTHFEARELISRADADGYMFRHALLRETCYAMLTEADRVSGHRRAGEWLEATRDCAPAVLAQHFDRGAEEARAAMWYARAGEQALKSKDLTAALRFAERGIELRAQGEVLATLRFVQLQVHSSRAEFASAEQAGLAGLSHAPDGSALWYDLYRELGFPFGELGRTEQLFAAVRRMEEVKPLSGSQPSRIACLSSLAGALDALSKTEGGALLASCEQAIAGEPGLPVWVLARFHLARGMSVNYAHFLDQAVHHLQLAAAAAEASDDEQTACLARISAAETLAEMGMPERCVEIVEHALRSVSAETRRGYVDLCAGLILTRAYWGAGAWSKAKEYALTSLESANGPRHRLYARQFLARIQHELGEYRAAEATCREALNDAGDEWMLRIGVHAVLAQVLLALDRREAALAEAQLAMQKLQEHGRCVDFEALVPLISAEALAANGRPDEARCALTYAHRELLRRAGLIADPALRESYLTGMRDHVRIFELFARWSEPPST